MGSRGPLPKGRTRAITTAAGQRLRPMPESEEAIARRLMRDIPDLTPADVPLVQDMACWIHIRQEAKRQLGVRPTTVEEAVHQLLDLMSTDTAHGNKEESRKNPLLIVLRTASEQLRADAQQLGATPAARARMPSVDPEQLSLAEILFADAKMEADANRE